MFCGIDQYLLLQFVVEIFTVLSFSVGSIWDLFLAKRLYNADEGIILSGRSLSLVNNEAVNPSM